MYKILPLSPKLDLTVKKHNLIKKYIKSIALLSTNPYHPGLHTELLEPKELEIRSFRIDRKYRGIFILHDDNFTIQIIGITLHYHK